MGKLRVRSKNRKKGFRWSKGQSGASNPEKSRHRDAARTRSILAGAAQGHAGQDSGGLTAESLLRHDALLASGPGDDGADGDAFSLRSGATRKTFETFASDWTSCDNASFQRLIAKFDPGKPGQMEMLAVLGAITDVIRERGGEESDANYFAALLTTLEETAASGKGAAELKPVVGLISMVIKSVPRELLQKKFPEISKLLYDLLTAQVQAQPSSNQEQDGQQQEAAEPYVARCLVGCLSVLLRAQSASTWQQESTRRVYRGILALCTHPKPKVRRAAQHAVCAVLGDSLVVEVAMEQTDDFDAESVDFFHPVAKLTAEECLRKLRIGHEVNATLHTLVLLKEVLQYAPEEQVRLLFL